MYLYTHVLSGIIFTHTHRHMEGYFTIQPQKPKYIRGLEIILYCSTAAAPRTIYFGERVVRAAVGLNSTFAHLVRASHLNLNHAFLHGYVLLCGCTLHTYTNICAHTHICWSLEHALQAAKDDLDNNNNNTERRRAQPVALAAFPFPSHSHANSHTCV